MNLLKSITCICALSAAIIFSGCGVDNFVYLYPVTQLLNNPSPNDPTLNFFSFRTADKNNQDSSGDYFKGYEIYYQIYNSESVLISNKAEIDTYNQKNPTTSFSYLVNSKKYSRMVHVGRTTEIPLIQGTDDNQDVIIRLTKSGDEYPARFSVVTSENLGDPRRSLNEGTSFLPFDYTNITISDKDVIYTSSASVDKWFVQAYVVTYGYDESYKSYYSQIFSLNYVAISK